MRGRHGRHQSRPHDEQREVRFIPGGTVAEREGDRLERTRAWRSVALPSAEAACVSVGLRDKLAIPGFQNCYTAI